MFRAAGPGPFDEAVAKATDENATSEDWSAILEVCDRVESDSANGPKEAVQSVIKRLAHRNANVQLYTLELAHALSQNCGIALHRELASRAFTEALLKLANDRNTHQAVRIKILERMQAWSDMFRSNTDLGIMQDAYGRLQHTQPRLQLPPSAPQKDSLTEQDRKREEEDLQRALKLSLEEEASKKAAAAPDPMQQPSQQLSLSQPYQTPQTYTPAAAAPQNPTQGTTAATVSRVRALFDFTASEPDELNFKKGDVIAVLESVYRDWWRGSLRGQTGIFPLNYVEILADPTPEELEREARMEAEVFAEIKNVEKLLTLLSASNTGPREEDSDEISKLYHQTLAIRPHLIKLIEKYSQKKDDFTQLNEKFIKARRDYEALLESSMSQPPQPNYQQYAMRPPIPSQTPYPTVGSGGPVGPGGAYQMPQQPPPDQRYHTPGPQHQDTYAQSPSQTNVHRHSVAGGPAPFYLANADIPTSAPPSQPQQPQQPQQQQQQPSQPSQPSQSQQQAPPQAQQAPQQQRVPSTGAGLDGIHRPPSPVPPVAAAQTYLPYNPHQAARAGVATAPAQASAPALAPALHPTYGHPQELSTSVHDSPVAQHNPNEPPPAPGAIAPSQSYTGAGYPSGALYTTYSPLQQLQQQPQHHQQQAPSQPSPPTVGPTSPPPARINAGGYYDARHTLPSQVTSAPPSAPTADYQAYVPAAPSSPPVDDYYRQPAGRVGY